MLRPALHSSQEQALGGSQGLLQGALLTPWDGVGQVCAGTALAALQQAPAQQAVTETERKPGPVRGALVTRQALCVHHLISSSRRLLEAVPWLAPHSPGEKTEEGMAAEPAQGHGQH